MGFDTIEINLVIVFDPEVSEFLEEAHTDIWLNLKKKVHTVSESRHTYCWRRFARQYFGSQLIDVEVNRNEENDENGRKYPTEKV